MTDHRERLARNDKSRLHADHFAEPWSGDEVEFLIAFFKEAKGRPEAEAEVAEALGRTIEACRQRYYTALQGRPGVAVKVTQTRCTSTEVYIGAHDDPEDRFWSPDYYTNGR